MTDRDPMMEAVKKALPDARSRERRGEISTPLGTATPIHCANCGRFAGYTFAQTEFMFYLCEGCDKHGTGIELPIVDPDEIKAITQGG